MSVGATTHAVDTRAHARSNLPSPCHDRVVSSVVVSYVITRPCPTTATPVPQKAFKRLEDLWRRDRKRGKSTGQPPRAATPSPSKGKKRSKEERQEDMVNEKARKLFAADEQLLELCNEVGLLQFRLPNS